MVDTLRPATYMRTDPEGSFVTKDDYAALGSDFHKYRNESEARIHALAAELAAANGECSQGQQILFHTEGVVATQRDRIRALEAVLREIVATKEDGTISAASLRTIARKACKHHCDLVDGHCSDCGKTISGAEHG
jgi:hypothetical protein